MRRGTRSGATSSPSVDPGERAVRFLNNLTHTGDFAGEPFDLRIWQETPVRTVFGTLRPDGTRRYRKVFEALPRKQGKTEKVAGVSLLLLMGQGRRNQRIYTASGDKAQAGLIFGAACEMIRADPMLDRMAVIYDGYKRIDFPAGNSSLQVLSSVPGNKHGLGPTAVLLDEYHVIDEELVNVLTTGFGARKDPLTWMITTAGNNRHSLCYDEWQYAIKVRDGLVDDPTYLPVIHAAEPGDDWHDERIWHKAMPALGDFCSLQFIREEYRKACERPRFENTFKQLYLNLWVEQAERWLSVEAWDRCRAEIDWEEYRGRPCYAALDLSTIHDLSALVLAFPNESGGFDILVRFWVPGESAVRRERQDKVPYPAWARQGHLTFTGKPTVDHRAIVAEVLALSERFDIQALAFDPAHAAFVSSELAEAGVNVVKFKQTPYYLNEPSKAFEGLLINGQIRHDGNPVLGWNVANVTAVIRDEIIMPSKGKSTERIDGVMATIMAIAMGLGNVTGPETIITYTGGLEL